MVKLCWKLRISFDTYTFRVTIQSWKYQLFCRKYDEASFFSSSSHSITVHCELTFVARKRSFKRFSNRYECRLDWIGICTDYERPVRKSSSLHDRKSNHNHNFLGMCDWSIFCLRHQPKISDFLDLCAFIGCP